MTSKAQITITRKIIHDDIANPEDYLFQDEYYREQDQARLDAWRADEWHFVGVVARAEIRVPYGHDWIITNMESPGLWGVESDSGEEYFESVYQEERSTLLDMLERLREFEVK